MRFSLPAAMAVVLLSAVPSALCAEGAETEAKAPATDAKAEIKLPPLSVDKTVRQSARIAGAAISYDATVGTIPVRDAKGKTIAEVVYTAYVVPGGDPAAR